MRLFRTRLHRYIALVLLGCVVIVGIVLFGWGRASTSGLDTPEWLILYSIDGRHFEPGQEPKTEEKLHGYPVLGKIEMADADKRKETVAALREGLAQSDGKMAKCFWPRHAIRTVEKGQTTDYVICFECYQLEVHQGSSKAVKPVTRKPQSVFNKHLKEAGIPLAPAMAGDNE
jgi:hypothetical protein